MNLFQYITLPITVVLFVWSLINLVSGRLSKRIALLGSVIWLTASIAILRPDMTIQVAGLMGIGRGADLVLYMVAITYLISMFYIYQRFQRIDANITEIIRHIALQNAVTVQSPDDRKLQENLDVNS